MPPFHLVPFASDPLVSRLSITGTVDRAGSALRATYVLAGERSAVVIPTPMPEPSRRDELWRATCFELFVAAPGTAHYIEVNLSPSGDWNAYSFTGYREGMTRLPVARFRSRRNVTADDALEIGFELELGPDFPLEPAVDVAVTVVLEHTGGARSYWALTHAGERPDFHHRDSFRLRL